MKKFNKEENVSNIKVIIEKIYKEIGVNDEDIAKHIDNIYLVRYLEGINHANKHTLSLIQNLFPKLFDKYAREILEKRISIGLKGLINDN